MSRQYLVGVSGGRDSVALLHWLLGCGCRKLIVCHLDHCLRGAASRADARWVGRLAESYGLTFETERVDVGALTLETRQSVETAARTARYAFFARVARRRRCRTLFLGHHADDAVETFLAHLFRGAGLQGQRGMQEISTRKIEGVELTMVRPLLSVWRSDINDYVEANRLKFREDASNENLEPLRNRMRHRIIPMLTQEFRRDIRKSILRAAAIAAEEDALLQKMLPVETAQLSAKEIGAMAVALQRRVISRWLRKHAVADVSFAMIERVRALTCSRGQPAKINLTRDRHARRRAGVVFIDEPSA